MPDCNVIHLQVNLGVREWVKVEPSSSKSAIKHVFENFKNIFPEVEKHPGLVSESCLSMVDLDLILLKTMKK